MNTLAYKLSPQQKTVVQFAAHGSSYCSISFETTGSAGEITEKLTGILDQYNSFKFEFVTDSIDHTVLQSVGDTLRVAFSYGEILTGEEEFAPLMQHMPLLRVNIEEGNDKLIITFTAHPVCTDLTGLLLLREQLLNSDNASVNEDISYIQFAEWQYQLLTDEQSAAEGVNYWQQKPAVALCRLRLEQQPMDDAYNLKSINITLPQDLKNLITNKAEQEQVSEESFFLSAYSKLICSLSTTDDVHIGIECHGREFDELNNTMGILTKIIPFVLYREFNTEVGLKKADEEMDTARYYQFYYSQPETAQFNYQFGYLKTQSPYLINASQLLHPAKLKFQVVASANQTIFSLMYDDRYLTENDINYFAEIIIANLHYVATGLTEAIDKIAGHYASQLSLPTTISGDDLPEDVAGRFRYIAQLYPNHIAVKTQNVAFTYQQIDELTEKAAASLIHLCKIKPDDFVGIMMDEDEWLAVSMLAVLKAGAAYIPIDAGNPAARLKHIIADAKPVCIITNSKLADLVDNNGVTMILMDELLKTEISSQTKVSRRASQVAYMIYTSGTTGMPKGVMVTDANLLNYTDWLRQCFSISPADQSLLQASYAYDLGYTSLWGCLLSGASLHVLPASQRQNTDWLVEYIKEQNISFLKLTPSVFYLMVSAGNIKTLQQSALRLIISGGEKIDTNILQHFEAIKKDVVFVNHYGPTETTVGVIFNTIEPGKLKNFIAKPVIGKPINNVSAYILNAEGALILPGERGEIYISGKSVSKGYHNREQLNQEKFILKNIQGDLVRLYRTGDMAYRLTNGNICIEGRIDDQVKIRGHRIELSEIKLALEHCGIAKHILSVIKAPHYGEELVGYYQAENEPDILLLRMQLQQHIPEYMIPAFFIRITTIPLTANGKVDYKALPDPYRYIADPIKQNIALTDTERIIAEIWASVLHQANITPQSDFFLLGGDSIKAIQIIAKINRQGLRCQLADIFNFTTVGSLAQHLKPEDINDKQDVLSEVPEEALVNYSLSPMQEAMYFHYKAFPNSKANIVIRQFEVTGKMNIPAFKRSVKEAVDHYDILRVRFTSDESSSPVVQIRREADFITGIQNIPSAATQQGQAVIDQIRQKWIDEAFDLESDLPLRINLFEAGDDTHVILLAYHHIIMDGWCFNVIMKGILSSYYALCNNLTYTWPNYTSFTKYLEWLKLRPQHNSTGFWTEYLNDFNTITSLPIPVQAADAGIYDAGSFTFNLSVELTKAITNLCNSKKTTLNIFFQAAWGILLGKYNDTNDTVFGITVAGRPYELDGFESMVGLFINTIPLRVKWNDETSVSDLLSNLTSFLHNYQSHQYLPLPEVQACSVLNNNMIDHLLVFENYPLTSVQEESDGSGIAISSKSTFGHTNYPLAVIIYPGEQVHINFAFNRNVYTDDWMEKFSRHFHQIIEQIAQTPTILVNHAEMVTVKEREELLNWSHSTGNFDQQKTIIDYFNNTCALNKDKIAIEDGQHSLTYGRLELSSKQLAQWLIKEYHIEPGDKIGIYLPPSVNIPIVIWGIFYCGAAYVPMDVEHPAERVSFIAKDSSCKLIITQKELIEKLQSITATQTLLLEDTPPLPVDEKILPLVKQDNLAYVIYTSGSTGLSKGCLITHLNLMNLLEQKVDWLQFNSDDVWIMTHSYAFDFSVWEQFGALLNGGRLYIPQRDEVRDIAGFRQLLQKTGVTILNQTPAAFYLLLEDMVTANTDLAATPLRMVMFGGDKLNAFKLKPWLNINGSSNIAMFNLYGITEVTVHATWHHITKDEITHATQQSIIGRPIPGTSVYVLNNQLQLCPAGVFGELVVGGNGVTAGYYNRPELMAHKFIPDPFNTGKQMYRSGDYGRWLTNGTLEYLNRKDDQIQIRGFRVEPGEIMHHLQQHAQISKALVIAKQTPGADIELIAYLVPLNNTALPEIAEIKNHLSERLPAQFIPRHIIFLDELPLTFNGKINKDQLPLPAGNNGINDTDAKPADIIEQTLTNIWKKELDLDTVGINDNFFDVGGHSLKAVRLMSEVQKQFNVTLPIVQLYKDGTINGLAVAIRSRLKNVYDVVESDHLLLKDGDPAKTLFFFPPAVGYAFGFAALARHLQRCRVYGINFIDNDTLQSMANYVQNLQPEGDIVLCGFSAGGSVCFHVAKLLEAEGRRVKGIIMLDSRRFITVEPLSDEEIVNIADEYLHNPLAQDFVTSPVIKSAMRKRIEASTRFIHGLEDSGMVQTDIHYICSETNRNNQERIMAWQEITGGEIFNYQGSGPHASMLNEPYIADNVRTYQQVIDHIWKT